MACRVALAVITCIVSAHAQDFDFGGMGGNQNCPAFQCSSGSKPVQRMPMSLVSEGCGGGGGGMMMMNPGKTGTSATDTCCHIKSGCYQICGMSKKKCDKVVSVRSHEADSRRCTHKPPLLSFYNTPTLCFRNSKSAMLLHVLRSTLETPKAKTSVKRTPK